MKPDVNHFDLLTENHWLMLCCITPVTPNLLVNSSWFLGEENSIIQQYSSLSMWHSIYWVLKVEISRQEWKQLLSSAARQICPVSSLFSNCPITQNKITLTRVIFNWCFQRKHLLSVETFWTYCLDIVTHSSCFSHRTSVIESPA